MNGTEHSESKCETLCDKEKQLDSTPVSGSKCEVVPKTPTKSESEKSDAHVTSPGTPVLDEHVNGPSLPITPVKLNQNAAEIMEPSTPVVDEPNGPPFSVPCSEVKLSSDAIIKQPPKHSDAQVVEHEEAENENVETFADPGTPTMDEPVYDSGLPTSDGDRQVPVSSNEHYVSEESSEGQKIVRTHDKGKC